MCPQSSSIVGVIQMLQLQLQLMVVFQTNLGWPDHLSLPSPFVPEMNIWMAQDFTDALPVTHVQALSKTYSTDPKWWPGLIHSSSTIGLLKKDSFMPALQYQLPVQFEDNWNRRCLNNLALAFSALTMLARWQEGHPACKKTEWWGAGMVMCLG